MTATAVKAKVIKEKKPRLKASTVVNPVCRADCLDRDNLPEDPAGDL